MRRPVCIASAVALAFFVGVLVLLTRGPRLAREAPQVAERGGEGTFPSPLSPPGLSSGRPATGAPSSEGGESASADSRAKSGEESIAEREARRRARRAARERDLAAGDRLASGAKGEGEAGVEGGDPGEGDASGKGVLRGARLTEAFVRALEENDLGELQGLLISELTLKGTRFAAEDLPQLFEALLSVEDYGLQKLVLTHLGRIDAPPEELVGGYLGYLETSEKLVHSEEIFKELVRIGGDASLEGMTALLREHGRDPMRSRAAEALGELGDARAVPALRQALYGMDDPRLGKRFVEALAKLGGQEAIASLVGYCSREGYEATLPVIREIRDPDAAPILAESLNGNCSEAYQRTVLAKLRIQPDPRILPDMAQYLRGVSASMARNAIDAVAKIVDPRAAKVLEDFAARQADPRLSILAGRAAQRIRSRLGETPSRERRGGGRPG